MYAGGIGAGVSMRVAFLVVVGCHCQRRSVYSRIGVRLETRKWNKVQHCRQEWALPMRRSSRKAMRFIRGRGLVFDGHERSAAETSTLSGLIAEV